MMRGNLIVSPNDEVITVKDKELGLLYRVKPSKHPIYLYAGPPTKKMDRSTQDADSYQLVQVGEQAFPAVLVTKNQDAIGIQEQLKVGQHVIARQVPGIGKDIYEVVTFDPKGQKVDDMPESGLAITIKNKGYVLKSHLQLDTDIKETFEPIRGDIFPNKNLIDDVHQSIFGDCFLLSSILSILHRPGGEEYIKSMMVQDGNHTIVRLYDPNTHEPVFYRIQNTMHCQNSQRTVKHLALWVHILEKAYTAHALKKNMAGDRVEDFYYSNPSFRDMFGGGGKPTTSFMILTGQEASEFNIHPAKSYPWDQESLIYSMSVYNRVALLVERYAVSSPALKELNQQLIAYVKTPENLEQLNRFVSIASDVSGNDILTIYAELRENKFAQIIFEMIGNVDDEDEHLDLLHAASHYVAEHIKLCVNSPLALSDALKDVSLIAQMGKFVKHDLMVQGKWGDFERDINVDTENLTFENVMKSFSDLQKYQLPQEVYQAFKEYVELNAESKNLGWDGELGSGLYSPKTRAVFNKILHQLAQPDAAVVASTRNSFPKKVPGLRAQHAYSISTVSEDESGVKYVHVRNPWGRVGRKYHFDERLQREPEGLELASEERGADFAEARIELSDFVRYFGDFSAGHLPAKQLEVQPLISHRHAEETDNLAGQSIVPPQRNFFQRHAAKLAGLSIGMVVGAAIGAAIGFALLPLTFGISVPLFAAIGAVIGGAVLGGLPGGLIGRVIDNKRAEPASYMEIPTEETDTDTESMEYVSMRRKSLSLDDTEELASNVRERDDQLRVSQSGLYRVEKGKDEMPDSEQRQSPSPRRK